MPDEPNAHLALLGRLRRGILTTIKRDGRPQLSVVSYHCDLATAVVRISTRSPLAKTANLRRDPRISLLATTEQMRPYVVAEGDAELGAVAQRPDDATVDELVEHYRELNGEHPDWDEFRAAMVAEERLVVRFTVTRTYGMPPLG
ncbi:PPOX class F420-dependent oxidoreductase [Angustibacter luteus]|uniref:PPOX class F420-dependent oxidoreductase n=1 Tax=Angustibacter luteus TaxID=658456 RepID=A0ABW1JCX6_9ACTN